MPGLAADQHSCWLLGCKCFFGAIYLVFMAASVFVAIATAINRFVAIATAINIFVAIEIAN